MRFVSNLPPAVVARVPRPAGSTLGAVLVARDCGYLAVCVLFHGVPQPGLEVAFREVADGKPGAALGTLVETDGAGIARLPRVVPAGLYLCEIERQEPALVATVTALDAPFIVVLPVGRPYHDVGEGPEHLVRGDDAGAAADGDQQAG